MKRIKREWIRQYQQKTVFQGGEGIQLLLEAVNQSTKMRTEKQPLAMAIESVTLTRGILVEWWGECGSKRSWGEMR